MQPLSGVETHLLSAAGVAGGIHIGGIGPKAMHSLEAAHSLDRQLIPAADFACSRSVVVLPIIFRACQLKHLCGPYRRMGHADPVITTVSFCCCGGAALASLNPTAPSSKITGSVRRALDMMIGPNIHAVPLTWHKTCRQRQLSPNQ